MKKVRNLIFSVCLAGFTICTVLALAFVIFFIVHEAVPFFGEVKIQEFLFGDKWMPIDYTGQVSFGIKNFITATIIVSLIAMGFSIAVGLGAALWLSCVASAKVRSLVYPVIDLLAGIPSVIYGFIGLTVLVKIFYRMGVHTGSCVLAAAVLLSVMLLPFLVSSCADTILKVKEKYLLPAQTLGISKWYAVTSIILPASLKNILMSMILAIGRAMGETMAVMMVIGNANLFPALLGKSETIASVIALEMGTAVVGSLHYHALYAAGFVLMMILLIINISIQVLHDRLAERRM